MSDNPKKVVLPAVHEPADDIPNDLKARYSNFDFDPIMFWNTVGLRLNRITTTLNGPQTGPTMSSRALGLLHLAMHDAYFAAAPHPKWKPYLDGQADMPATPGGLKPADAVSGAAHAMLVELYGGTSEDYPDSVAMALDAEIAASLSEYGLIFGASPDAPSFKFGADVSSAIFQRLGVKDNEIGAGDTLPGQEQWKPNDGRFEFRDEPSHPVRLRPSDPKDENSEKVAVRVYHGPYYGRSVQAFAIRKPHHIGDPPFERTPAETMEYDAAFREVYAKGGAPGLNATTRTADEAVAGVYWAYDGVPLLGTPPRLYNKILRVLAQSRRRDKTNVDAADTADFARLFALCNVAMADAGLVAWQEKYRYRYWRPLSGVREDDASSGPGNHAGADHISDRADPFWLTFSAPATNTNEDAFKPPFPAYPSGHATFGASAFQCARLFYKERDNLPFAAHEPDALGFTFVSEELDGVSRHLDEMHDPGKPVTDQPGLVTTRVVRRFESLWRAMYENGASRVYLGVHWIFDAFAGADVVGPDGRHKQPAAIDYRTKRGSSVPGAYGEDLTQASLPVGGVPLGIDIANDIYGSGLRPSPLTPPDVPPPVPAAATAARAPSRALRSQSNIR